MSKINRKIVIKPPGPKAREWIERNKASIAQPAGLVFSKADSVYVTDVDGNVYIDFTALNCNTGHTNPKVIAAVKRQIDMLGFNEGLQPKVILAEKLRKIAPRKLASGKVGFNRGGTPAAERVMLMVRAYNRRRTILVYQGGYCVENVLVQGEAGTVLDFITKLRAVSGIREVKYTMTPVEESP